ncbi:MAG: hypothetical protein ACO1TE_29555 [Prosthecobacter sp.]
MPSFATLLEPLRRRRIGCSIVLGMVVGLTWFASGQQGVMDSGMAAFMQMIPLGTESEGAVIPSFDATGRRSSLITADVMRRIDNERLYAEGLVVQIFNIDPKNNLRLDLHTAFYHMSGGILRSTERSRVSRADFQVEGDSLVFDTAKNQGRMTGNIRMVIFDTSTLSGEGTSPPAAEPQPAKK